jgi:uncharacterized protein
MIDMRSTITLTDEQMKAIEAFALRKYSGLDYAHNVNHAHRTVKIAEYLAKKEGANVLVCKLGALLHQYHPEGAEEVNKFLETLGIESKLREHIVNCVESVARSTVHKAKTLEAKIVFDADKLQIVGPFGIIRQVAYLIENRKLDFNEAIKETKELQIDIFNRLQTHTAKRLAMRPHELALEFFNIFEKWDKADFSPGEEGVD